MLLLWHRSSLIKRCRFISTAHVMVQSVVLLALLEQIWLHVLWRQWHELLRESRLLLLVVRHLDMMHVLLEHGEVGVMVVSWKHVAWILVEHGFWAYFRIIRAALLIIDVRFP